MTLSNTAVREFLLSHRTNWKVLQAEADAINSHVEELDSDGPQESWEAVKAELDGARESAERFLESLRPILEDAGTRADAADPDKSSYLHDVGRTEAPEDEDFSCPQCGGSGGGREARLYCPACDGKGEVYV